MTSDEQIRVVCAEVVAERDPKRRDLLLGVVKNICAQYLEQRGPFLASSNPSERTKQGRSTRVPKVGKRAA